MQKVSKIIGNNILRFRKAQGLTQPEFGAKCKPVISQSRLSQIERGEKLITVKTIEQICKALGIRAFELFIDRDSKTAELPDVLRLIEKLPKKEKESLMAIITAVLKTNGTMD